MSARHLVETVYTSMCKSGLDDVTVRDATDVVRALTASGYRILGPGEGDAETLEAAADAMEIVPSFGDGKWAARHIRALKDKRE